MKKLLSLLLVGILGGASALLIQKYVISEPKTEKEVVTVSSNLPTSFNVQQENNNTPEVTYTSNNLAAATNIDFTVAAENTVNAVVHVKNVTTYRRPRNYMDYLRNGGVLEKAITGAGSGVIITEDGYIVTNNHVIKGASEIKVTLNNNRTYNAKVVGTEPNADIALLKIEHEGETFDYVAFGDSDTTKIGEWVLAVGNPFNLTSTVTAGIISAKARDLDENDTNLQSFIQTDAAINPGNSGGALVNTQGELIGINTAITSQTGSYIGYAFAVPSNHAKKIVQDILEYGDVQKGILGIKGGTLSENAAKELELDFIRGVYVSEVTNDSGADKAGIKKGDIVTNIDGVAINKFEDLAAYINTKRPNDVLNVTVQRKRKQFTLPVELTLYQIYAIKDVGVEITNASPEDLAKFKANHGVKITRALTPSMRGYGLEGIIITEIDKKKVNSVSEVKRIIQNKEENEDIVVTFLDQSGEKKHFIFN